MSYWNNNKTVPFEVLKGKTISLIEGMEEDSDVVKIVCEDNTEYVMSHYQDCCENVRVGEIVGDVQDLIGSEILRAEEATSDTDPEGYVNEDKYRGSFTWTFYKLATRKGYVDIRWLGESNGYYSESVDFEEVKANEE